MFIGKFSEASYGQDFWAQSDIEDTEGAVTEIIAHLEDQTGNNISFEDIDFFTAKPFKIRAETKYTVIPI